MDDELMGTNEAAEYLKSLLRGGMSVAALKYHVRQGNITPTKIGKTLVYRRSELDEFAKNRRRPGRPRKNAGRLPKGGENT